MKPHNQFDHELMNRKHSFVNNFLDHHFYLVGYKNRCILLITIIAILLLRALSYTTQIKITQFFEKTLLVKVLNKFKET